MINTKTKSSLRLLKLPVLLGGEGDWHGLVRGLSLALLCSFSIAAQVHAEPVQLTLTLPGPGTALFLPADLIPFIGADAAEGVKLHLKYVGSGGVVLTNLVKRNADFSMSGLPALMSMRAKGTKVVAIAAAGDLPQWALIVRKDLKTQVRSLADLRGRKVGMISTITSNRTAAQQFMEILMQSVGMTIADIRVVSMGLRFEESAALLQTKEVDAVLTDLSIASRLVAERMGETLISLGDSKSMNKIPGGGYLHSTLGTRQDVIDQHPENVKKMVNVLKRSLAWIASHTPEQIVAQLQIKNEDERKAMLLTLKTYPNLYSADGRFHDVQLRETEVFFRKANKDEPEAQVLQLQDMVDKRWVGIEP